MSTDNGSVPSTSSTHLPPSAGPPDESPLRGPTTAPGDRGAQLARLGDRIAELSARIQAATHELLVLIREFDEQEGWDGCLTCAHWLSWRAGLSPGAAREHVRVARALGKLPGLSDAMRRGKVSYSKVRAVTRVATPENEQTLLDVALAGTAEHVERIARAWRRIDRNVEQAEDRRREASRAPVHGVDLAHRPGLRVHDTLQASGPEALFAGKSNVIEGIFEKLKTLHPETLAEAG